MEKNMYIHMCCFCYLVTQSCPTLLCPLHCNPPDSSVHVIYQARILEWVTISLSRGSSQPRDWTQVSCIGRWTLYHWATWEAHTYVYIRLHTHTHTHARARVAFPGGNGNPLQYCCLGNHMDRGAWWVTVQGTQKSRTWLSDWAHMCIYFWIILLYTRN